MLAGAEYPSGATVNADEVLDAFLSELGNTHDIIEKVSEMTFEEAIAYSTAVSLACKTRGPVTADSDRRFIEALRRAKESLGLSDESIEPFEKVHSGASGISAGEDVGLKSE